MIGSPCSRNRQRAAARIGAFAGFGIVARILGVVMLCACVGAFSGHVVALCATRDPDAVARLQAVLEREGERAVTSRRYARAARVQQEREALA